jgi:hypothetical protein
MDQTFIARIGDPDPEQDFARQDCLLKVSRMPGG